MIFLARLVPLFAGNGLKFAAVFGMLAMVGTWDWRRIKAAESRGAESVRVQTIKANDAAVKTSERVRAKSSSSGLRGAKRDPNSID
jgi:hypothetical protein